MMIEFMFGIFIITFFCIMFYLEDRSGGGLYDPDPSASYRHKKSKK
jgi:hypothetical protein